MGVSWGIGEEWGGGEGRTEEHFWGRGVWGGGVERDVGGFAERVGGSIPLGGLFLVWTLGLLVATFDLNRCQKAFGLNR